MAIELTRKRLRSVLAHGASPLAIPPYVLAAVAAAIVAVCLTSVVLGIRNAHRDAAVAHQQFGDAQALLALPPLDTSGLQARLDVSKFVLAAEQAMASAPSVDPASDAAATLLVQRSEAAGLSVNGISRLTPATTKFPDATYDVQGIRISVVGQPSQILTLLSALHKDEPSLIPVLASMTINEAGVAHADIGFDVFTPLATPTAAVPAPKPKAKS